MHNMGRLAVVGHGVTLLLADDLTGTGGTASRTMCHGCMGFTRAHHSGTYLSIRGVSQ